MSSRIRADGAADPGETQPIEEPQPDDRERNEPAPSNDRRPEPANDRLPGGANEDAPAAEPEIDWKQRVDALTRQKYEAQRQRDEFAAMLQQYRQQQSYQPPPPGTPEDPREQGRREGRQQAAEEQLQQRFNEDCNTLFRRGQDEFGDMQDAVSALNAVGYGNRPDALVALTRLPDGHRVYRQLASDLDNAARILSLAPMEMAIEFAKMSGRENGSIPAPDVSREAPAPPAAVTRTPPPLRPLGGNSTRAEKPLQDVSMAEFIRRRDRDERRSRIAR